MKLKALSKWLKNVLAPKKTDPLESSVEIEIKHRGRVYYLILAVIDKNLSKCLYYKEGYEVITVELDDPDNAEINDVVNNAIDEFLKH